jgi:hypothetical protein
VVAVEHRHDQRQRLGSREHERWWAQASADPVAAVRTAHRLDRDVRVAQGGDVPPRSPVRDAEPVGQPVGSDAGAGLDELERQQRASGGVLVADHPVLLFRTPCVRNPR